MERLEAKAVTTATDQEMGTFEALVSAWDADREQDVISPRAFDTTIAAWRESGKNLPRLLNHSTTVVGHVDPFSMRPSEEGLVVSGEVDRSTDEGRMVWRTIKSGTAGFSIGYSGTYLPLENGGRALVEVDLLEIIATSTPMHPATRALSWKSEDASIREAMRAILTKGVFAETKGPLKIARFPC